MGQHRQQHSNRVMCAVPFDWSESCVRVSYGNKYNIYYDTQMKRELVNEKRGANL